MNSKGQEKKEEEGDRQIKCQDLYKDVIVIESEDDEIEQMKKKVEELQGTTN